MHFISVALAALFSFPFICYHFHIKVMIEAISKSANETKKIAVSLAEKIKKRPLSKVALIIALEGDLGSGKTTFIQGLAQELGVEENILSPTFVIQKDFPLSLKNFKNLYHIDAYRLKNPLELLELGFEDLIKNPENLIVIEWADKVRKILPENILKIKLVNLKGSKRKIQIFNF
ncbi:MAG: tRNA (adenosine(37)-N6)-threonylcarbamoyltransferase complex ATPase subunit type 1 TsaE [Parcubacteria group bacterium]|nr:tRNA (adenosine(37)-N6)-threonylcarbamoyltransferase complex ATPase subunit type 1 TsaE [Parcubacteria group bacterium]